MKQLIFVATLSLAAACSTGNTAEYATALDRAENAIGDGRYAIAQTLADSLVAGADFDALSANQYCRLALLLMQLGENSENEVNTAMAARCIAAASLRDSDSTASYIRNLPNEDRARLMMLSSLNEAQHTMPIDEDSIPIYEE